jgi:hypothetical protein
LNGPVLTERTPLNRFFISPAGTLVSGFFLCAAKRSSTSASSAGDNAGSSKSSARRSAGQQSICRWLKVSAGNSFKTSAKLMVQIYRPSHPRQIETSHHPAPPITWDFTPAICTFPHSG